MSLQSSSNGPSPHPDSTFRSLSEAPLLFPVQESMGETQEELVIPSPAESSCPSLPTGEEEQGCGSLQGGRPSEDDTMQEEAESDPQPHHPPLGDSPSFSPPSSPLQVGGAERGRTAESVMHRRVRDAAQDERRQSKPVPSTVQCSFHAREPGKW